MHNKHSEEARMTEKLESLEQKRESLYKELHQVGDFRRGIISFNYRKCGKKNCACAQKGHLGHPQYLWNSTIKGKSYAKSIKTGPELQKYMAEIENHDRFKQLCKEIIEVNEQICNLRPVAEMDNISELQELKKNLKRYFMKRYKKKLRG